MPALNVRAAAVLGGVGILCGAFGAHGLKGQGVEPRLIKSWETAAHYQLIHAGTLNNFSLNSEVYASMHSHVLRTCSL
jgi:uncharacterized membrane protein YgdD (TMEM256/DUF423 family)